MAEFATPHDNRTYRVIGLGIHTVLVTAGLGLALYLGIVKLTSGTCGIGNCQAVLQSKYSSIAGIPVGFIGLAAWLLLYQTALLATAARVLLVGGSLYFIGVQAFIIGQFCPACMLHALCAIAVGLWPNRRPQALALLALSPAAILAVLAARPELHLPAGSYPAGVGPQAIATAETVARSPLYVNLAGIASPWLGTHPDSALLIISFTCHHCMTGITELLQTAKLIRPPRILLITGAGNQEITEHIMAAIIARGDNAAAFKQVILGLQPVQVDMLGGNLPQLTPTLARLAPDYLRYLPQASARLAQQNAGLVPLNVQGTPLLISPSGSGQYTIDRAQF